MPIAYGHLEKAFLQLKLVKHASSKEDTLDQLLRIDLGGLPLPDWDGAGALELWWREKTRCIHQKKISSNTCAATSQGKEMLPPPSFDWEEWEVLINTEE